MELSAVIGVAVLSAVLAVLFRQYRPEYAVFLSILSGIAILLLILTGLAPALGELRRYTRLAGMDGESTGILLRALGICFLTQIACDTCRDAGESAIASKVEMAGKAAILLLTLPLFSQVLSIALDLIAA